MALDPVARIEQSLQAIRQHLGSTPSTPRSREQRARLGTFERALMNFAGRVPTKEQVSALLEGVLELHHRVFGSMSPRSSGLRGVSYASCPSVRAAMTGPRVSLPPAHPSQYATKPPPLASRAPVPRPMTPSPPRVMPPGLVPPVPPSSPPSRT